MKKTIAMLLVAILSVGSVFAAMTGEAKVGFGGNLDNGNFGFIDQSTNVKVNLELATDNAENVGEGDIYASIKASLSAWLYNGEKGETPDDPMGELALFTAVDFEEAKVGGENWYVSILGMPSGPDFAKSAIDTYTVEGKTDDYGFTKKDYTGNVSLSAPYAKTNGVEIGVYDYKFGFGLLGDYSDTDGWKLEDNMNLSMFAQTPEYDFDGLTAQVAAVYTHKSFEKFYKGAPVGHPGTKTNVIGVSGKVGFANDTLSASVATDLAFNLDGDKFEDIFGMDLAANFTYDFITADAYFATKGAKNGEGNGVAGYKWVDTMKDDEDKTVEVYNYVPSTGWGSKYTDHELLSAQVKFDLNSFDVPVAITASVKDILKTVDMNVKAEITPVEELTITVGGGYVLNTYDAYDDEYWPDDLFMGQWKVSAEAEYDLGFAKVSGSVSAKNIGVKALNENRAKLSDSIIKKLSETQSASDSNSVINSVILGMSVGVESETIIPGATVALKWENANDLLKVYDYAKDTDNTNLGKITASCKIAF